MSVYVDDMYRTAKIGNRRTAKWCHMTADSSEELVAFAKRLGLQAGWIQYPGTWKEHFDVTTTVRARAVSAGAVEVTMFEGVRASRARWEARRAA